MKKIYFSIPPDKNGGGPSIFVWKIAGALAARGHKVVYDYQEDVDVAMCIINVGNIINKAKGKKTRVMLRIDGIYNLEYNKKFNRKIRPDMISLHQDLYKNIPLISHTVFQSEWSKNCIWAEIVKVDRDYSVIHNGANTNNFKYMPRKKDSVINLIHVGKMRDAYLMEMIMGVYTKLKKEINVNLILAGTMDGGCSSIYNKYKSDKGIKYTGSFSNNKLNNVYNMGDIFLDVRQGCSSNNVVAEAQSCGLPCVCSKWGGDQEMIVDGKTGVVVDGGRWDYNENYINGMCLAVKKIIPRLDDFKEASRNHAVQNLSVDIMVEKYIKAMEL